MRASPDTLPRLVAGLDRLLAARPDPVALRRGASALLRRHLGFDVAVWATVDPSTVVWTDCVLDGFARDPALEAAIFRNEYGEPDVLKLRDLARGTPAGALAAATGGRPETSPRYREILRPMMGASDELRVALRDGESCWGVAVFYRSGGAFAGEETEAVAALSRRLGEGMRRAILEATARRLDPASDGAGVVLVGPGGAVEDASAPARAWLGRDDGPLAAAVPALAARAAAGEPAHAVLPAPGGGWLLARALPAGERVAIVVEPAAAHQLGDVVLRAYGLTPREREVVELVARGLATKEIARALGIAAWTVQDHLKSVFAKVGVDSRAALVAALFFRHVAPAHGTDAGSGEPSRT